MPNDFRDKMQTCAYLLRRESYDEAADWALQLAAAYEEVTRERDSLQREIDALNDEYLSSVRTVRGENPPVRHGSWVHLKRPGNSLWCSECNSASPWAARHNYCPNCGARMDGDNDGK